MAALLRSCIENVLRNAVHYTKANGKVVIAVQRLNGTNSSSNSAFAQILSDGVRSEALPRLFESFCKPSTASDRGTGETGLGLFRVIDCAEGGDFPWWKDCGTEPRWWRLGSGYAAAARLGSWAARSGHSKSKRSNFLPEMGLDA